MAELSAEEKAKQRLLKFQEAKKRADEAKNHGDFPKEDVPEFKTCVLKKARPRKPSRPGPNTSKFSFSLLFYWLYLCRCIPLPSPVGRSAGADGPSVSISCSS
jgi:hypothetical protein